MNDKTSNWHKRISDYVASLPEELLASYKFTQDEYSDGVIPFEIYKGTHGYIERIANQINKAYHFGIYDGCLVLMRRLIETLLILAFRELGIDSEIKDKDGAYLRLSKIINKAENNKTIALTLNARDGLKPFKVGGDLSAHNPYFCARQKDILNFRLQYRALVEELLNKAGILK
ncbi:MAG: hypothetical protein KAV68_04840 [Dehalococcoidales bacterium]|nr:hypothetical protein [Dehalococcoidales bacterium]